jgi:hypothetical protein
MTAAPAPDVPGTPLPSGGARYGLPRRDDLARRLLSATALVLVLLVPQHGVFGESERCSRGEVAAVTPDRRGLEIKPVRGKTFTLPDVARLRGAAGEAECRWLASALREALGLESPDPRGAGARRKEGGA